MKARPPLHLLEEPWAYDADIEQEDSLWMAKAKKRKFLSFDSIVKI